MFRLATSQMRRRVQAFCTLVTPISVALPAAVDNQALVQVRIMSTNAVGNDEWVGVDDISVNLPLQCDGQR